MRSQTRHFDWPLQQEKPNKRFFYKGSCHMSPPCIISRKAALSLHTPTTAKAVIIYIPETSECPWGTLSLSLSPESASAVLSPPCESTHTWACAHSNDWLMNLNSRGFQCLDSIGKKTDAYSADISHRPVCCLRAQLDTSVKQNPVCVCVCLWFAWG